MARSDVYGMTYSVVKGNASRRLNDLAILKSDKNKEDHELSSICSKHHDGLIIQPMIGNCLTKKVLIDDGSSTAIIFLSKIKAIEINENGIVR
ncbi:hypothetical protein OSB04_017275 [Centaurea solstitialis]|uniref:Uncharacterized protein n=1 Tax=Centaurea solstitialis TaxID=347529 RepID=A0AA38T2K4_9ASTR|nr:hypothetical protein OSB04_017275 [Centaurea solstitialis]